MAAAPEPSAPSSPSGTAEEQQRFAIGAQLSLLTTFGESINGTTVLAFDCKSNCLLLREPGAHNGVSTIRILSVPYIKEITSSENPPADFRDPLSPIPFVDEAKCRKRYEHAMHQAQLDASRVGSGVTKEAQAIFDALVKTMPCRWQEKAILVLEEILVSEPYTPESAKASRGELNQATLQRVRKVLSAERLRLGLA